jgi:hypothetical protein
MAVRDCSWLLHTSSGFGNIRPDNFKCSSDRTLHLQCRGYNCIAWAAGKTDKWWWPDKGNPCAYWPIPIDPEAPTHPRQFIKAFESEGFSQCRSEKYENGYEKVAIYVQRDDADETTHMARLLPSGVWTSKMGGFEDIEHDTPQVVSGDKYGVVTAYLKRKNPLCQKANKLKKFHSFLKSILKLR